MYTHCAQSSYVGTTLRPKHILFGHMDPEGKLAGLVGFGVSHGVQDVRI